MLFLLQAAAQQIPPIDVTVQTPPGMAEWGKILMAAGVGALFGIAGSVGMEFVKPLISKRHLKKTILRHLDQEFRENYAAVLDAGEIADDYDTAAIDLQDDINKVIKEIGKTAITTERFQHYRDTEKSIFYEVDEDYRLAKFYLAVGRGFRAFPDTRLIFEAIEFGKEHARLRKMGEIRPLGIFTEALSQIR